VKVRVVDDDVAGNEPGRYCSPRDRTAAALSSRNQRSRRPYIEAGCTLRTENACENAIDPQACKVGRCRIGRFRYIAWVKCSYGVADKASVPRTGKRASA